MSTLVQGFRSRLAPAVGAAVLLGAGAAIAADTPKPRAAALQAVVECRKVADASERLACYDAATGALETAERSGEVVVIDKAQVQEAQRAAFGFNFRMPAFLSGSGRGDDGKPTAPEIDRLEAVVLEARQVSGKWRIVLEDGALWYQTDNTYVARPPKKGSKVVIKRAAMGSYFLSVEGQLSMRAKRDN